LDRIGLLDYKLKPRHIDAVNQLVACALAFVPRERLPVKVLKRFGFHEKDYFECFPLKEITLKSAQAVV
jgi:hypothetical protein